MAEQDLLVGSTGFVGGNLLAAHAFGRAVHSATVAEAFGTRPELCVYAGVPAAMFLANSAPEKDLAVMAEARENLRRIAPKRLVLISSIAVYRDSRGRDEESPMEQEGLSAYGANRLQLEAWVHSDFPEALIVRLPALYGKGLKKNFLYDIHTLTPAMLTKEKYAELSAESSLVKSAYSLGKNGFYALNAQAQAGALRAFFAQNGWNSLFFTDSRSVYQFYPLGRLWQDIATALGAGLRVLNLATPPVSAAEVYFALTGRPFVNELAAPPFQYDLRTRHAELFGGQDGYLFSREEELAGIAAFMREWR